MPSLTNEVYKYLKKRQFMAVATTDEHPWIAITYYLVDPDLTLYFFSSPNALHVQHINKNSEVACAITDYDEITIGNRSAVKLWGKATPLTDPIQVSAITARWEAGVALSSNISKLPVKKKEFMSRQIIVVEPKQIEFFNEEMFGIDGFQMIKLR
jgi:uncharacterized protein YhbP (UPF0306 family)